jgi:hypothetical protein
MTFNYYLRTNDDEIKRELLFNASQTNDTDAIRKLLEKNKLMLTEETVVEISSKLLQCGFKVDYSKKYKKGSIGIGQEYYQIMQEDWDKA